ncbi:MAG: hypothetical protein HS111_30575 [Kofleriaceae bacterium]|nr:hypothetical protein [Kofleriaceae bacterium]
MTDDRPPPILPIRPRPRPTPPTSPDDGAMSPPPLDDRLAAALRDLTPVTPRRPWRDLARVGRRPRRRGGHRAGAGPVAARRDLDALPRAWVIAYGGAWLGAFVIGAWLALVPRAGHVVPAAWRRARWRRWPPSASSSPA